MVPLAQFLPYVLPYVVTCPNPLAEQVIRSVCIDFCSSTNIVQNVASQTVLAGVQDYDVDVPSQMVLCYVLDAFYGATRISPAPLEAVRSGSALSGETVGTDAPVTGQPGTYFIKTPGLQTVSLYPVPDTTLLNGLTVRASFAPTRVASHVDNALFNDWVDVIAAGAIAQLLAIPNQLFGDAKYAPLYAQKYSSGTSSAFTQARKGQLLSGSRVKPVSFT